MPSERRGSLMRVVFDTNVIVSELSSPRAPPAELLERLEGGLITLVTSGPQIDELRDMRAGPRSRFQPVQLMPQPVECHNAGGSEFGCLRRAGGPPLHDRKPERIKQPQLASVEFLGCCFDVDCHRAAVREMHEEVALDLLLGADMIQPGRKAACHEEASHLGYSQILDQEARDRREQQRLRLHPALQPGRQPNIFEIKLGRLDQPWVQVRCLGLEPAKNAVCLGGFRRENPWKRATQAPFDQSCLPNKIGKEWHFLRAMQRRPSRDTPAVKAIASIISVEGSGGVVRVRAATGRDVRLRGCRGGCFESDASNSQKIHAARPSLPAPTTGNGSNGTPCRRSNESRFSTAEPLAKVVATLISIHERAKHSRFAVLGQGEGSRKRMAVDGGPCPRMDAGVALGW